jgi:hypothetical protein
MTEKKTYRYEHRLTEDVIHGDLPYGEDGEKEITRAGTVLRKGNRPCRYDWYDIPAAAYMMHHRIGGDKVKLFEITRVVTETEKDITDVVDTGGWDNPDWIAKKN